MSKKKFKIGLSIGSKLSALISFLLLVSSASIVYLSTRLFVEDNTALIQQMNADSAAGMSQQMREHFENLAGQMHRIGAGLYNSQGAQRASLSRTFLKEHPHFIGAFVHEHLSAGKMRVVTYAAAKKLREIGDEEGAAALAAMKLNSSFSFPNIAQGEVQATSIKLEDGGPALAIGIPFVKRGQNFSHSVTALFSLERLKGAFGEDDLVTRFMVDRRGNLVVHPRAANLGVQQNAANLGIVKEFLRGQFNNSQTRYVVPESGEPMLGAFRTVGFGGLGVITEVPEAKAFEAARRVEYRATLVAVVILCVALLFGYLFAESISSPIYSLVKAANKIASGDFAISLKPKSRDEVGYLSLSFNEMANGLAEREKLKDTFNKFHSEEIAAKILSGEVKLGGERMNATVFFSDIRSFTALSENLPPEKVVELLNEYMEHMVAVIQQFKGVVDKYVGDAIMATWGVPLSTPQDTYRALSACLAMRQQLHKLNDARIARGEQPLYIGMGLNSGPVTAGNIGSEKRMEYTVIGDSVNTASRVEAMTKTFGTDLLISQTVYDQVKEMFICESAGGAEVKGKTGALQVFKVKGYYDQQKNPIIIETPYSSYAAESSDKVKVPQSQDPQAA